MALIFWRQIWAYDGRMRLLSLTSLTFVFFSQVTLATSPPLPEIVFKKSGKEIKRFSIYNPPKSLKTKTLEVHEPHEDRKRRYSGYSTQLLLDWAFGDEWKKAEEILFTCADGYQPSVPAEFLRRYETLFAISAPGEKFFTLHNKMQNEKNVQLGPAYLVWNNLNDRELKKDGANWWPYQIVSVELVKFKDRFSKTAPPEKSSRAVSKGFLFYRRHCMSCHAVNGEGGQKGPDLNQPDSLLTLLGEEKIRGVIMNPRKYNPKATMAGFEDDPAYRDRLDQVKIDIGDLIAYLKAMAPRDKAK